MNDKVKVKVDMNNKKYDPAYVKQNPYVGEDGIYVPCEEYVRKGYASTYKCILTKDMFVEAYNKWIKDEE